MLSSIEEKRQMEGVCGFYGPEQGMHKGSISSPTDQPASGFNCGPRVTKFHGCLLCVQSDKDVRAEHGRNIFVIDQVYTVTNLCSLVLRMEGQPIKDLLIGSSKKKLERQWKSIYMTWLLRANKRRIA